MAYRLRPIGQETPFYGKEVTSTIATSWVEIGEYEGAFSCQVVWTAGLSPVMTCELEISNDKVNFSTYPGSSLNISGATGNHFYDISECGAQFMRVKFTVTSGSAYLSTLFNGRARV